jgi:hypothetical protein
MERRFTLAVEEGEPLSRDEVEHACQMVAEMIVDQCDIHAGKGSRLVVARMCGTRAEDRGLDGDDS